MIRNVFKRINEHGLQGAVAFYGKAYAWRMSVNYRQNQARFADYSTPRFVLFVVSDYIKSRLDKLIGVIEHALIGQASLPTGELTEYTIRLILTRALHADSVVYAFGVSRHIETEEQWASQIGCTVHLFDPTEPAIEFMEKHAPDPLLKFDPMGVWTYTGTLKFYMDKRDWVKNLSAVNLYHNSSYVEAPCMTLPDIMKKYGHDHIDMLKMDIEGSALPVLLHMLQQTTLRPPQIVGSLERPLLALGASLAEIVKTIRDKAHLFRLLKQNGYLVYTHHAAEFTAIHGSVLRGN